MFDFQWQYLVAPSMNKNHPERERQAAGTMAHSVRTAQTYYRLRANQQRVATVTALIEKPVTAVTLNNIQRLAEYNA